MGPNRTTSKKTLAREFRVFRSQWQLFVLSKWFHSLLTIAGNTFWPLCSRACVMTLTGRFGAVVDPVSFIFMARLSHLQRTIFPVATEQKKASKRDSRLTLFVFFLSFFLCFLFCFLAQSQCCQLCQGETLQGSKSQRLTSKIKTHKKFSRTSLSF